MVVVLPVKIPVPTGDVAEVLAFPIEAGPPKTGVPLPANGEGAGGVVEAVPKTVPEKNRIEIYENS